MTKPDPTSPTPDHIIRVVNQMRDHDHPDHVCSCDRCLDAGASVMVLLSAAEQAAREEALGGKDVADAIRKAARRAALEEAAEKLPRRRSGGPCPKPPLDRAFFVDWLRARADENEAKGEQDG